MRKMTNESLGAVHTGSLKENKKKNIKGITLIALVITIVVLLILAGISISALTQTGLFEKTKQAEQKYENAQVEENITLASYENGIDTFVATRDSVNFSGEELLKEDIIVDTTTTWKTLNLEFEIPSVSQYNYLLITYGLYKEDILRHMETELLTKAEIENSIKNNAIFTLNSASGNFWSSADVNFKSDTILCIVDAAAANNSRTKFAITSIQGIK